MDRMKLSVNVKNHMKSSFSWFFILICLLLKNYCELLKNRVVYE